MPRSLTVPVLALFLVVGARAELICEQPVVQLGEVKAGAPLSHKFTLVNRGNATVELLGFKTSCSCFRPDLPKRILLAGESVTLDMVGNTLAQPAGQRAWRIGLEYREGSETRQLAFEIRANLTVEVAVIPPTLTLTTEGPLTHELTLRDLRATPLPITAVQTSSPGLRTRFGEPQRLPQGGWARTITLEVGADYPTGRRDEVLAIQSRDPDYPEIRIPVTVVKRERGAVAVRPSQVRLTAVKGEPLPARLVLLGDGTLPVEIERVEVGHTAIQCTHATVPGSPTTLKVRVDVAQVPAEGLRSGIRVIRRSPTEAPIVVPVLVEWDTP